MGQSGSKAPAKPTNKQQPPAKMPASTGGEGGGGQDPDTAVGRSIIRAPDVNDPRDSEGYRIRRDHTGKWRRVEEADFDFD